jgi:hypothetical protein
MALPPRLPNSCSYRTAPAGTGAATGAIIQTSGLRSSVPWAPGRLGRGGRPERADLPAAAGLRRGLEVSPPIESLAALPSLVLPVALPVLSPTGIRRDDQTGDDRATDRSGGPHRVLLSGCVTINTTPRDGPESEVNHTRFGRYDSAAAGACSPVKPPCASGPDVRLCESMNRTVAVSPDTCLRHPSEVCAQR